MLSKPFHYKVVTTVTSTWPEVDMLIRQVVVDTETGKETTEPIYLDLTLYDYEEFKKQLDIAYQQSKELDDAYKKEVSYDRSTNPE